MKEITKTLVFLPALFYLAEPPDVLAQVLLEENLTYDQLLSIVNEQKQQLDAQARLLNELSDRLGTLSEQENAIENSEDFTESSVPLQTQLPTPATKEPHSRLATDSIYPEQARPKIEFSGYGIMNYQEFDWDTHADRRNRSDLEYFIFEAEYQPTDRVKIEAEIEFEHGGVGVTQEFDVFEEFGEFEQEIEQGGEITLEKLQAEIFFDPRFNLKVGHIVLPMGLLNKEHRPSDYFSATRLDASSLMIPVAWHENGVGIFGEFPIGKTSKLDYEVQVVNGLDSTGFSSSEWVKSGYQRKFEYKVSENLAYVFNLDLSLNNKTQVGFSYYLGDSSDNRPKADIDFDADVEIGSIYAKYINGPLTLRAQLMEGNLENSGLITTANKRLSNNLGAKRSPVAENSKSFYVEAGYDISRYLQNPNLTSFGGLQIFARYHEVDTMEAVASSVFKNPRWDRENLSVGLIYEPFSGVLWKLEKNWRELGTSIFSNEDTISSSISYEF